MYFPLKYLFLNKELYPTETRCTCLDLISFSDLQNQYFNFLVKFILCKF